MECDGETIAEAMEEALGHIKSLWDRTAAKPLEIDRQTPKIEAPQGELKRCRVSGAEVIFDPIAHTYTDRQGRRYTGGSTFASRFKSPFLKDIISGKMANKYGVDADKIQAMWTLNAEASSTVGTSVHAALQLYGEYLELSKAVKNGSDESALTSNPILRPIVQAFFEGRDETAFYEEFIADAANLRCGLIDRLVVEPDGLWVEDFKTNADIHKSETILEPFKGVVPNSALGVYWIQLSYYAAILMAHGRNVKGLRIHHWDGAQWVTYEHPALDLTEAFQESK